MQLRSVLVICLAALQVVASAQTPPSTQSQQPDAQRYPLIPWPASLTPATGEATIDSYIVESPANLFMNERNYLQGMLRHYLGENAKTHTKTKIIFKDDPTLTTPESYRLSITTSTITISAHSGAAMFDAIQTFRQLLPPTIENSHGATLKVPCVEIADQPAYAWRGMMLDVSRHFFSPDYIRKYIDRMALYKYNKLHLHLTDDQGWRIEIKKYPLLTKISGWRSFNDQDSACMKLAKETDNPDLRLDPKHLRQVNGKTEYGGSYTQEEIRAIIQYAAARHIEVIPEIDMPGHMMAAILLYPELTCSGGKGKDWRRGFSTPICPCKENVLDFAKEIFTEIAALFPSKYIHIGGDEVNKSDWQNSPLCQQFMQEHHLTSLDQLQSYFNDYMEAFFRTKGKTLVGWDEIVSGGIDSSAVVMYWRTWTKKAPQQAAQNGNKVVMSADGPLYFDALPDRNSLSAVYHYNPVDPIYGLDAQQQQNIIGVQANLWTERVPTEQRADYLIMPRMTALAEVGWTHQDLYNSYLQRLNQQYDRLDRMQVRYRLPDLTEVSERQVFIDTASFFITPPIPGLTIRYTENGFPTNNSPILKAPITISQSRTLKVAAFTKTGRRGDVQTISFDRQTYATAAKAENGQPGLQVGLFKGEFQKTTNMQKNPDSNMVLQDASLPAAHPDAYGLQYRGYINVPEQGIYSFFLTSDDGSFLKIADRTVVDNDGAHSSREKSGQVALEKGAHLFALDYMDLGGGGELKLRYSLNNGRPQPVPGSWFSHNPL